MKKNFIRETIEEIYSNKFELNEGNEIPKKDLEFIEYAKKGNKRKSVMCKIIAEHTKSRLKEVFDAFSIIKNSTNKKSINPLLNKVLDDFIKELVSELKGHHLKDEFTALINNAEY